MSSISIQVAGRTDSAGRQANQDAIWVCPDLSRPTAEAPNDDRLYSLSAYGALMAVADGMGGMSCGEVASQTVIDSLKASFSFIPSAVTRSDGAIRQFIRDAFVKADLAVKAYANSHPRSLGMGTTLVLAWLIGGKVYIAWSGDSRAYRYNRANGLARLSHDHSFVQDLVDSGQILEEEAFGHPNSNIITHCLSDAEEAPRCDIECYKAHGGDVILLCSDGLCGLLRDHQIEALITPASMARTLGSLWAAGDQAGWTDNATIALMRIDSAQSPAPAMPDGWAAQHPAAPAEEQPAADDVIEYPDDSMGLEDILPSMDDEKEEPTLKEPEEEQPQPKTKKTLRSLPILLAVTMAAIVIVAALILLMPNQKGDAEPKDREPLAADAPITSDSKAAPSDTVVTATPEASPADTIATPSPQPAQQADTQVAEQSSPSNTSPSPAPQRVPAPSIAPDTPTGSTEPNPETPSQSTDPEVKTQGAARYINIPIPSDPDDEE